MAIPLVIVKEIIDPMKGIGLAPSVNDGGTWPASYRPPYSDRGFDHYMVVSNTITKMAGRGGTTQDLMDKVLYYGGKLHRKSGALEKVHRYWVCVFSDPTNPRVVVFKLTGVRTEHPDRFGVREKQALERKAQGGDYRSLVTLSKKDPRYAGVLSGMRGRRN